MSLCSETVDLALQRIISWQQRILKIIWIIKQSHWSADGMKVWLLCYILKGKQGVDL
jgi:hypothetical protein